VAFCLTTCTYFNEYQTSVRIGKYRVVIRLMVAIDYNAMVITWLSYIDH